MWKKWVLFVDAIAVAFYENCLAEQNRKEIGPLLVAVTAIQMLFICDSPFIADGQKKRKKER